MRKEQIGAATPTDFLRASPRKYRGVPAPGAPAVPMPLYTQFCEKLPMNMSGWFIVAWYCYASPLTLRPWFYAVTLVYTSMCNDNRVAYPFSHAPGSLYKLVMPEREVALCSADEGLKQLSRAPHLFSLGITWSNTFMRWTHGVYNRQGASSSTEQQV